MLGNPEIRDLPLSLQSCRDELDGFLAAHGLRREPMDYYAGVFVGERMLAGGGFSGATVKCVAADAQARGLGLVGLLMSHLRSMLRARGVRNVFVFTRPENREIFESLAFTPVGVSPRAALLESDRRGLTRWTQELARRLAPGQRGAVVLNGNPFTLGHQFLIETAAAACARLLVLVVETDRSAFPFAARLALAEAGCAHLSNVTVAAGGPYIISDATFPSYFLKRMDEAVPAHAALDANIFASRLAPGLGITARFVGDEPGDPVTAAYNEALRAALPPAGVAVQVVPRRETGGRPISASRVRALIAQGRAAETQSLVPPETFRYISAHAGELAL